MGTVLTLESGLDFEPTYLPGCSFGKPPISVSLGVVTFGVTLDLFHLPYGVDVNLFKEYRNTATYWALTMHQAQVGAFPLFYTWLVQGSRPCHVVTLLTQREPEFKPRSFRLCFSCFPFNDTRQTLMTHGT